MIPCFFLFFLISVPVSWCHQSEHGNKHQDTDSVPVLMISVDAFRWNFAERIRNLKKGTPEVPSSLWELIEKGAFAHEGINSVFPTTVLPSQYTLVTGLFAENHGVVSDTVFDPGSNQTADLKAHNPEDQWVFGGEPIWKTMAKQSSKQVGCYMWIGCEHGDAAKSVAFSWKTIWHDRVDKAIEWLKDGIKLVLVSSPDIDGIGKTDGPDSNGMNDALIRFDTDIAYLLKKLRDENLVDRINLIIVSGHGIANIIQDQSILPITGPQDSFLRSKTPTMWLVDSAEGGENETIAYFKQFEHLNVFPKKNIPDKWHYQDSRRIPHVMVLADPGYTLHSDQELKGFYGYNNSISDMRGTLLGYGPAFLPRSSISPDTSAIDVYQLLCVLLNIHPAPNNGSTESFQNFVHPDYLNRATEWKSNFPLAPIIILSIILALGIVIASVLCYRSGECKGGHQSESYRAMDAAGPSGEKMAIIHKYDSELVILELDDDNALKA